jgi:hypothetical protein
LGDLTQAKSQTPGEFDIVIGFGRAAPAADGTN